MDPASLYVLLGIASVAIGFICTTLLLERLGKPKRKK